MLTETVQTICLDWLNIDYSRILCPSMNLAITVNFRNLIVIPASLPTAMSQIV